MDDPSALNAPASILVVDDDPVMRSLMRAALESDDYAVREAADGEEACRYCEASCPDLLVVDVVMPGMDGFALCRALRRREATAYVPILISTGLDDVASIAQAFEAGATDFISKPINWVILSHRVRYMLRAGRAFEEARRARRSLEESALAVQAANERLERRVEERTAELHAMQGELLRQERLSTLGQITATVAHELRNPLGAIKNTLFAVRQLGEAGNVDLGRAVDRMERSIGRCNKIICDLLDYVRARELIRRPVALDEWLGSVLDELKMPEGVLLERRLAAPGLLLDLDADRLGRAVVNLVANAVQAIAAQASPDEGRITVSTRHAAVAEIVVADNGPGIAKDVLPKVFEPLFSTKSFGTGLGLPMVKQIVEQHGGTISVASAPGRSTAFSISLPSARTQEDAA